MLRRIRPGTWLLSFLVLFFLYADSRNLLAQEAPATPQAGSSAAGQRTDALAETDEVLRQLSALTSLPLRETLRKSVRSREEIRAYVLREMKEEKTAEQRYAAERAMEAFGLAPKGFQLEPVLLDLLTEQVAGLYDPKAREFYIADWIPAGDQRIVMVHELTHALEDQHFHIKAWAEAARPNDDAEIARDAVLEGSAMVAMLDYLVHDKGMNVWGLPDVGPALLMGESQSSPQFSKAPPFIQHALLFPYGAGLNFTKAALREKGWEGLAGLFANPPASSQQILHPELYLRGVKPAKVTLPDAGKMLGQGWKRLDENTLGEFGLKEVLLQFLDAERAAGLAPAWTGDRYVLFEHGATKKLLLVFRLQLASPEDAARFAGQYSEALEKKHEHRRNLFRRPSYFSFDSDDGSVFLRCAEADCVTLEGGDEKLFEGLTKAMGWPPGPERPRKLEEQPTKTAFRGFFLPDAGMTGRSPAAPVR